MRPHLPGAKRTVQADGKRLCMHHGNIERLQDLPAQGPAGCIGDGAGDHYRQLCARLRKIPVDRINGRFCVQCVKNRLYNQDIGTTVHQAPDLLMIRIGNLIECNRTVPGPVDVRRQRQRLVHRANGAGNKMMGRSGDLIALFFYYGFPGHPCCSYVELIGESLHVVVGKRYALCVEGVGLDDMRTGGEVLPVNITDDIGACKAKQVIIAFYIQVPVLKTLAAIVGLLKPAALDHGAHCPIQNKDFAV